MEKIEFKQKEIKKSERKLNERNDWLFQTAQRLKEPIGKVGALLKGWDAKGIKSVFLSAESLSKDKGLPFKQAWYWHYNEVVKVLLK